MEPLFVLAGPTAVGKTALSIPIARALRAEIVNVDSRQLYRYMDIGTAKPTSVQQAQVRHHLLDLLLPQQHNSAAQFVTVARQVLDDLDRRGVRALVIAGSGLYLQALLYGLMAVPRLIRLCVMSCRPMRSVTELQPCIVGCSTSTLTQQCRIMRTTCCGLCAPSKCFI